MKRSLTTSFDLRNNTMKLKLNNVRLAFPALFEAKTVSGEGDPRFSAVFLMGPKQGINTKLCNL